MTADEIKARQKARSDEIESLMPGLIDKVKSENPDIINTDHIEEMAKSLVILKVGIIPTSIREGLQCPQPESSTSPKPQKAGKKTLVTSILDALEKDCLLAGEIPSESGQTETEDKS